MDASGGFVCDLQMKHRIRLENDSFLANGNETAIPVTNRVQGWTESRNYRPCLPVHSVGRCHDFLFAATGGTAHRNKESLRKRGAKEVIGVSGLIQCPVERIVRNAYLATDALHDEDV